MSQIDQNVGSLLFPVTPVSTSNRAQKYITSPLVSFCIFSSRAFSALMDNETCFERKKDVKIAILNKRRCKQLQVKEF